VYPAGWDRVRELGDSGSDPAPHGRPVMIAGGYELVGSRGAFFERLVAIALEHQLRRPPKCRSPGSRSKSCTSTVNEGLRSEIASPAGVSRWWQVAPILTPEDIVRRIAAECVYVDERGAAGIRLKPAAAIVRQ
jgi:hypothetical protein